MAKSACVYGPYPAYKGFRLVVVEGKARKSVIVGTRQEAERVKEDIAGALGERGDRAGSVVLAEYEQHLQAQGVVTARALCRSIERFLGLGPHTPLGLSAARAAALYEAEVKRTLPGKGRCVAAAAHQCVLGRTRRFYTWALSRGYVTANPFAAVKPIGRANTGKQQLRIEEARRFTAHALRRAADGDLGALAAVTTLLLGLRAGEVLLRCVRDLDDGAGILWIPRGKTKNARRRLHVPAELRPLFSKLAEGKGPDELLFSADSRPHTATWLWLRVQKLCDEAGVPRVSTHSLRGLHSTLALEAGATASAVASALGHKSFAITARHYAAPGTVDNLRTRRVGESLALASASLSPAVAALLKNIKELKPEELAELRAVLSTLR